MGQAAQSRDREVLRGYNETPPQCVTSWTIDLSAMLHARGLSCEGATVHVDRYHLLRRVHLVVDGAPIESEPGDWVSTASLHAGATNTLVLEFKEPSAFIPGWRVTVPKSLPARPSEAPARARAGELELVRRTTATPADVTLYDVTLDDSRDDAPLLGLTRPRRRRCRARPEP